MPTHKGVACHLLIEGEQTPEYGVSAIDNRVTISIIPKEDALYSFAFSFAETAAQRHDYSVYVDGQLARACTSTLCTATIDYAHWPFTHVGIGVCSKFQFGKVSCSTYFC